MTAKNLQILSFLKLKTVNSTVVLCFYLVPIFDGLRKALFLVILVAAAINALLLASACWALNSTIILTILLSLIYFFSVVVGAFLLCFRFSMQMLYYRLIFIGLFFLIGYCFDLAVLEEFAPAPEGEIADGDRAILAAVLGYFLLLNISLEASSLWFLIPFMATLNNSYVFLALESGEGTGFFEPLSMKRSSAKLLQLLEAKPQLRNQLGPLAMDLTQEQLQKAELAAPQRVLSKLGGYLPFKGPLVNYGSKLSQFLAEHSFLEVVFSAPKKEVVVASKEFLEVFAAETSNSNPLDMEKIFEGLLPGKTALERHRLLSGAYIHSTVLHGLTVEKFLTLEQRCALVESDKNLVKPLLNFKPGNLWAHSLVMRDSILGVGGYVEQKNLVAEAFYPTWADGTVGTPSGTLVLEVKRGNFPLDPAVLEDFLQQRAARFMGVKVPAIPKDFMEESYGFPRRCIVLADCSPEDLELLRAQLEIINASTKFKGVNFYVLPAWPKI